MITGHGMIPRTGDATTTNAAQNINELNKNLRTLNKTLCCTSSSGDLEYIPIYEYRDVQAPGISGSGADDLYYQISGTNFSIAWKTSYSCADRCGGFLLPPFVDSIHSVVFEDSIGSYYNTNSPVSVNYALFPNKEIYINVTVTLNSGFRFTNSFYIVVSGGTLTVVENFPLRSNTNTNNVEDWVNLLSFKIRVADLLEVRQNGVFIEYQDLNHNPYVPTYCLQYHPVYDFIAYSLEDLPIKYNSNTHILLTNDTLTIPANSAHKVSYSILQGNVEVTRDAVAAILPIGVNATVEATTLINTTIEFDAPTTGDIAYISIINY